MSYSELKCTVSNKKNEPVNILKSEILRSAHARNLWKDLGIAQGQGLYDEVRGDWWGMVWDCEILRWKNYESDNKYMVYIYNKFNYKNWQQEKIIIWCTWD